MTKRECAVITAYTGVLCGDFNEFHKYIEELFDRPIYTHELADEELWEQIKERSKHDFIKLSKEGKLMKYIRTKDGYIFDQKDTDFSFIKPEFIIKQADTIEELCDEFVYVDEEIKQFLVSDDIDKAKAKFYNNNVYGAIWTDKGLVYVARMNEKGELKLL